MARRRVEADARAPARYTSGMRYFEDVEPGRTEVIGSHAVTKEEIIRFAEQWDPQPFHLDEEAASESVLGGLSASSCHTYSISSLIFSRHRDRLRTAAMLGLKMRFPTPVRPGDVLTLHEICLDKRLSRSRPQYGIVKSRSTLRNGAGEDVMVLQSSYLVERREAGVSGAEAVADGRRQVPERSGRRC